MISRAWCRFWHGGEFLRRSIVGGGALVCLRCGAGFVDLAEAGLMDDTRVSGWPPRPEVVPQLEQRAPEFVAQALVVRQGGRVRKVKAA